MQGNTNLTVVNIFKLGDEVVVTRKSRNYTYSGIGSKGIIVDRVGDYHYAVKFSEIMNGEPWSGDIKIEPPIWNIHNDHLKLSSEASIYYF